MWQKTKHLQKIAVSNIALVTKIISLSMSGNCLYTFQKDDLLHKIRIYDLKTTLTRCKVKIIYLRDFQFSNNRPWVLNFKTGRPPKIVWSLTYVPDYVSVSLPLQWISKLHWGGFHWMKRPSFDRKALVRGFRQLCMSKKVRQVLHITCLPATVIRDRQFACDRRFKIYFSISLYFEKIQSNWTDRIASDHGHSV